MKRRLRLLPLMIACTLAGQTAWASGGEEWMENAFAPEGRVPTPDLPAYAAGRLGVVPASFWRIYQFIGYRALTGHPLSAQELSAIGVDGWHVMPVGSDDADMSKAIASWMTARQQIRGATAPAGPNGGDLANTLAYGSCYGNAFSRAAQTLNDRLKSGGQQWAAVWLAGQDAVFANCADMRPWDQRGTPRPASLPAKLPANAPAWLVQDHEYQVAAAQFYAENYDAARAGFLAVARNKQSPWQGMAPYLAARCLIRKATMLNVNGNTDDPKLVPVREALLTMARAELVEAGKSFAPARSMVTWVDARLHPQARLAELAGPLATSRLGGTVQQQNLIDFLRLMDDTDRVTMMNATDPMVAWIGAMQGGAADDPYDTDIKRAQTQRQQAVDAVRKRMAGHPDPLWLMALLTNAGPGQLTDAETKAAAAVASSSPAYMTLQYHLARLALAEGHADRADDIVNAMLSKQGDGMGTASRNRWLALKLQSAKTEAEFLKAAHRQRAEPDTAPAGASDTAKTDYDTDFYLHLFHDLPNSQLNEVRQRKDFPATLVKYATEVVWTRAVILGDYATADALSDDLARGRGTTKHLYARFKAAKTDDDKRLAAAVILVNTPELHPEVVDNNGVERMWGCKGWRDNGINTPSQIGALNFLDKDGMARAQAEQKTLLALPIRTAWLAPTLLKWAEGKPDDPEAPKALHFLVVSTRLECPGNDEKPRVNYSKEAFQLLHKLYPKSEWTANTKYYF